MAFACRVVVASLLVALMSLGHGSTQSAPEQVHLSMGDGPNEMIVSWVTQTKPDGVSQVAYWKEGDESSKKQRSTGTWKKYNAGSFLFHRNVFHHRVTLSDLLPGQTYFYQAGNGLLMTRILQLRTLKDNDPDYVPKIAIYGDLGNENGQSIPWLTSETDKNRIDVIFHIGDLAYDLGDNQGKNGDEFMNRIQPIASKVPYQVTPGNHEAAWNFSHYDNLFSMMDQRTKQINNHFYTTTVGPVRVISISTEFYYFVVYGRSQIGNQFRWLEKELKEANKPENRKTHPWLIVLGHRPLYCSSNHAIHCTLEYRVLRSGWFGSFALDKLFYDNKVDVYIAGHMHVYERMFPVFDGKSNSSKTHDPYENPIAPVHLIAGSAGCKEELYKFDDTPPEWSARRISDYGYSMLYPNSTHLRFEQISVLQSGQVIDSVTITKSKL